MLQNKSVLAANECWPNQAEKEKENEQKMIGSVEKLREILDSK